MNKFKVGDKVKRVRDHKYYRLFQFSNGAVFTVSASSSDEGIQLKECTTQAWYDDDKFELYQEPAQKTFNPKPGDIIVTVDAGDWICTSKDDKRFAAYPEYDFFGVQGSYFQGWMADGSVRRAGDDYDSYLYQRYAIKEIIPAASNNLVAIPQQPQDLSFQVKALELENQMLRMLLRQKGVDV